MCSLFVSAIGRPLGAVQPMGVAMPLNIDH